MIPIRLTNICFIASSVIKPNEVSYLSCFGKKTLWGSLNARWHHPLSSRVLDFFVTFARFVPKIKRKLSHVGSFESLKRSISDRKVEKKRKTAISILAPLMSDLNHRSKIDRIGADQRVEDNNGSSAHSLMRCTCTAGSCS